MKQKHAHCLRAYIIRHGYNAQIMWIALTRRLMPEAYTYHCLHKARWCLSTPTFQYLMIVLSGRGCFTLNKKLIRKPCQLNCEYNTSESTKMADIWFFFQVAIVAGIRPVGVAKNYLQKKKLMCTALAHFPLGCSCRVRFPTQLSDCCFPGRTCITKCIVRQMDIKPTVPFASLFWCKLHRSHIVFHEE